MPIEGIIAAGAPVASGLLGMIGQKKREARSLSNTKDLMNLQMSNQKQLDKYGQELQLDTWKKTSYPAQVAMLEEAGLNPGLLYGNGGSGGVTGSQGGGSAASGNAPAPQPMPMDLASGIMAAANIKLMQAQTEKTEAETRKTEAETTGRGISNEIAIATIEEAKQIIRADSKIKNTEIVTKTIEAAINYYLAGGEGGITPNIDTNWGIDKPNIENSTTYKTILAEKGIKEAESRIQTAEADLTEKLRHLGANNATIQAVVSLITSAMRSR